MNCMQREGKEGRPLVLRSQQTQEPLARSEEHPRRRKERLRRGHGVAGKARGGQRRNKPAQSGRGGRRQQARRGREGGETLLPTRTIVY